MIKILDRIDNFNTMSVFLNGKKEKVCKEIILCINSVYVNE